MPRFQTEPGNPAVRDHRGASGNVALSWRARVLSQPTHWTRLSCHRFRANEARLQLSLPAYNLVNLWRSLVLPKRIDASSLTRLQQRLVKTGGRPIKHARCYWLLLAEGRLHRRLFGQMLRRIWALRVPNG